MASLTQASTAFSTSKFGLLQKPLTRPSLNSQTLPYPPSFFHGPGLIRRIVLHSSSSTSTQSQTFNFGSEDPQPWTSS
ncbi:hypothetical protein PRUPE_1G204100 [Prunus persica]|uniref:Uncharacterized protein n=1 Tax=Prunus persica TaxID=3760 RepID=A0A251R0P8_PRUPE|nr:hypothetical protein PRUPE_1G204100 [Prunus persica]